jgi:hypothetical protein
MFDPAERVLNCCTYRNFARPSRPRRRRKQEQPWGWGYRTEISWSLASLYLASQQTYRVEELDRLVLVDGEETFLRDGSLTFSESFQAVPIRPTLRMARAEVIPRNMMV